MRLDFAFSSHTLAQAFTIAIDGIADDIEASRPDTGIVYVKFGDRSGLRQQLNLIASAFGALTGKDFNSQIRRKGS